MNMVNMKLWIDQIKHGVPTIDVIYDKIIPTIMPLVRIQTMLLLEQDNSTNLFAKQKSLGFARNNI